MELGKFPSSTEKGKNQKKEKEEECDRLIWKRQKRKGKTFLSLPN